ncbi:MAG: MurR/RpiR family transcriptional regulator [Rhodocyclaceae bacterium]|nr:MurR/RpiR family transcriptional regulator [Rhodocyclaceae bacterium]
MSNRRASPPSAEADATTDGPDLERRLAACYESLPNSERPVADLLLNFPAQLATHSATELALLAGASKAAVSRLIQRLGYPSYAAARAAVRGARQWGSPVYLDDAVPGSGEPDDLDAHIAADIDILRKTLGGIDRAALTSLVEAMAGARRLLVIGHRNSALLADYLRSQLGMLRDGVELAPMHGTTLAEGMAGLGPQDVLIAVGFRRRVPAFSAALAIARRARTPTLVLTDPSGAALAGDAHWVLSAHCRGASMFDSYVAAVSLINHLSAQLAQRLGARARARLREVEALHGELGDLL